MDEDRRIALPRGAMAPAVLKPRQVEVLHLLAFGMTAKGAAGQMGVSENTAKKHIQLAYRALGVGCREDAFRALGWLVVP